jgi:hypothetical protein
MQTPPSETQSQHTKISTHEWSRTPAKLALFRNLKQRSNYVEGTRKKERFIKLFCLLANFAVFFCEPFLV